MGLTQTLEILIWGRYLSEFLPSCLISESKDGRFFSQNLSHNLSWKGNTPCFTQSQKFRRLEKKTVNCYFYQLDRDQLSLP